MPSVSSQPFLCLSEANKSVFCCINGLRMFVLSRLIIIKPVAIHLICEVPRSDGKPSFLPDSHSARFICIWRCRRIRTLLDPSPAKKRFQASLWLQVESPEVYRKKLFAEMQPESKSELESKSLQIRPLNPIIWINRSDCTK